MSGGSERHRPEEVKDTEALHQHLVRSGFIEYDRVIFFSDAVFAIAITLSGDQPAGTDGPVPRAPRTRRRLFQHPWLRDQLHRDRVLLGRASRDLPVLRRARPDADRAEPAVPRDDRVPALPDRSAQPVERRHGGSHLLRDLRRGGRARRGRRSGSTPPSSNRGLASDSAQPIRLFVLLRTLRIPAVFVLSIPVARVQSPGPRCTCGS